LHSNGYSLARRIVFDVMKLDLDATFRDLPHGGDVLLEPTRIYVRAVLPVREHVHAMAHITGGGITGNLPRVLPEGCRAIVAGGHGMCCRYPGVQKHGGVEDSECSAPSTWASATCWWRRPTGPIA